MIIVPSLGGLGLSGVRKDPRISLLLHFDGTNGSTTFTDHSMYNHAFTISSTATIATSQSVFGGSSGSFNGYITTPYHTALDLTTGDFTISGRIRPTSVGAGTFTILALRESGKNAQIYIRRSGATLQFFCSTDGTTYGIQDTSCGTLSVNTWHAFSFVRIGSTFSMYLNGVLSGSASSSSALYTAQNSPIFIMGEAANAFVGQMDELRILKGLGRYVSDYTVETNPYSNFTV